MVTWLNSRASTATGLVLAGAVALVGCTPAPPSYCPECTVGEASYLELVGEVMEWTPSDLNPDTVQYILAAGGVSCAGRAAGTSEYEILSALSTLFGASESLARMLDAAAAETLCRERLREMPESHAHREDVSSEHSAALLRL